MKNLVLTSTLLASLFFVGCGADNKTTGNVGATATVNGACPAGYWYTNGQCTNGATTIASAFSYNAGYYADNYSGTTRLTITDATKMREFFKLGMGVCDRGTYSYQNIGSADCSYYLSGYIDVILQFPPQMNGNALATIIARPKTNPYVNYYGSLPSGWDLIGIALGSYTGMYIPTMDYYQGAYRDPLQIQMAVYPINNSAGFIAQGYGDAWTGMNQTVIGIEVANGSANSTNLNFNFKVGGVTAAQGTMTRCQYQNCGL